MYQLLGVLLMTIFIVFAVLAIHYEYVIRDWFQEKWWWFLDIYDDSCDYLRSWLRPKPNNLNYNYMSKTPKKSKEIDWRKCEYCCTWSDPIQVLHPATMIARKVCGHCGKEFEKRSKTYHSGTRPRHKVKIEIEEIPKDPYSI